jgi:transcriptional regulator with GAF, ATPase, and Fis domain
MTDPPRPAVAVCGTVASEVQATAGLLQSVGRWRILSVCWPDEPSLSAALSAPANAFVMVGEDESARRELGARLARRPPLVPLVVIGGQLPVETRPSCWLERAPSAMLLGALLAQLIPPDAEGTRAWRRKSDMIIGNSPAIEDVLRALDRVAPSWAPVLITGESGTGKELVARALHVCGPRARKPFVAINCAAIPETLFEAELFGYTRGAFTGAVTTKPGVFEAADGGTLFLDELGEMPLAMQAKLLRVLETGELTRLGSTEVRRVEVRLVAATNRNLEAEVRHGRFREDLYYRVRVYPVHIPPLRERPEDIPPLIAHYANVISEREKHPPPAITPGALEKMLRHRWPGNTRELINTLQRAILLAHGNNPVEERHIVLPDESVPIITAYSEAKAQFEARYYGQLLRTARGNVSLIAKLAHKTRKEVYDALRRLNLDPGSFRSAGDPAGE